MMVLFIVSALFDELTSAPVYSRIPRKKINFQLTTVKERVVNILP